MTGNSTQAPGQPGPPLHPCPPLISHSHDQEGNDLPRVTEHLTRGFLWGRKQVSPSLGRTEASCQQTCPGGHGVYLRVGVPPIFGAGSQFWILKCSLR